MHACEIADTLEHRRPSSSRASPGVLSALGMLLADVTKDYSATVLRRSRGGPGPSWSRSSRRSSAARGTTSSARASTRRGSVIARTPRRAVRRAGLRNHGAVRQRVPRRRSIASTPGSTATANPAARRRDREPARARRPAPRPKPALPRQHVDATAPAPRGGAARRCSADAGPRPPFYRWETLAAGERRRRVRPSSPAARPRRSIPPGLPLPRRRVRQRRRVACRSGAAPRPAAARAWQPPCAAG